MIVRSWKVMHFGPEPCLCLRHDHILYRYEVMNPLGKGSFGQAPGASDGREPIASRCVVLVTSLPETRAALGAGAALPPPATPCHQHEHPYTHAPVHSQPLCTPTSTRASTSTSTTPAGTTTATATHYHHYWTCTSTATTTIITVTMNAASDTRSYYSY